MLSITLKYLSNNKLHCESYTVACNYYKWFLKAFHFYSLPCKAERSFWVKNVRILHMQKLTLGRGVTRTLWYMDLWPLWVGFFKRFANDLCFLRILAPIMVAFLEIHLSQGAGGDQKWSFSLKMTQMLHIMDGFASNFASMISAFFVICSGRLMSLAAHM